MSEAVNSIGVKFQRWDMTDSSSGESWVDIAEITGFNVDKTRETIDVTSLTSTRGYKEFIGSFRDSGTCTLPMNFLKANYDLLNDDFEAEENRFYRIVLTDPAETTLEFEGLVTGLKLSGSVGAKIASEVSIKVSGPIDEPTEASSGI
jgi:predicted secreted protein